MQYNFRGLSLSYKNSPVEIREKVALSDIDIQFLINQWKQLEDIQDIFVISTCNRTELYYASETNYQTQLLNDIKNYKKIDFDLSNYFIAFESPEHASEHLFSVALGLESQVVGDLQIINQVKRSYQISADCNIAGTFLHRLLHSIFFTNKKVTQETCFRSGAASTSYASVELIDDFATQIKNPQLLVVGIGEIGSDVVKNLKDNFAGKVTIINRTLEKAKQLAEQTNFDYANWEDLETEIEKADIIVCSVAKNEPLITKKLLEKIKIHSYKYFIDLSMPRSIEPNIEDISGVVLYNIDQIQNKANEALQKRIIAIPDVKAIMHQSLEEFYDWSKEMEISPTIQKLKNALEQIRQEELDRYAKKISDGEMLLIEQITKNMMQKIIKLPTLQLKAACKRGEADSLIEVLSDLFNLEKNNQEKSWIG
ncbi:MAG: glutamyl-tRNA reductase [Bacteroidetes bacterium]|nr:MAG: glutamyl-tRNA reductase [Bacteroidota bacterium]TAG87329.1 MAG: glutamyl-tRNA reductase [Bacteroidota bacterium]